MNIHLLVRKRMLVIHFKIMSNVAQVFDQKTIREVTNQHDDACVSISILSSLYCRRMSGSHLVIKHIPLLLHLPQAADEFPKRRMVHLQGWLQLSMCRLHVVVGSILAVQCTFVYIPHSNGKHSASVLEQLESNAVPRGWWFGPVSINKHRL